MIRPPPRSPPPDTLFPYTTPFRSVSHHGIQLTQSIRIKLARSSPLGATSFPLGGFLFLTNLGNAHDIPNRFDHRVNVMIRDKLDEFLVLLEFLHDRPNGLTKHIR